MRGRMVIFDPQRKVLILSSSMFDCLSDLKEWANKYIIGICPELKLLIMNGENKEIGFLQGTPHGFEVVDFKERIIKDGGS